jgi:DNA-damage-inducible protein J
MSTVNVTLQVDGELKQAAEVLFDDLGMNLSTAFNIFLRQSVREQQLPFLVSRNVPNALTQETLDRAAQDEDVYGPFDSVEALMEALDA